MPDVAGRLYRSGSVWFAVSVAGSVGGQWLVARAVATSPAGPSLLVAAGLVAIGCAGVAAWRLAREDVYAWLLPLAAINLLVLEPGRSGEAASWRLEWGVMGLGWTLVAVLVFTRLLARSDELHRRIHLEGAFMGLSAGLVAAVVYALFEPRLPVVRAQWVAVTLLFAWWIGVLVSSRRYRWHA